MARLLFLLLAVGLVVFVLKRVASRGHLSANNSERARSRSTEHSTPSTFEKTQRCARCGAFIPAELSRPSANGIVCRDRCVALDDTDSDSS